MPHKHTRRQKDASTFELPPTEIAKPLPIVLPAKTHAKKGTRPTPKTASNESKKPKRKRGADAKDDAPRAFKRLMAFASGNKPRDGLDDGSLPPSKKKKAKASEEGAPVATQATAEIPTIKPGEKLSEFAARVDAALPVSGLVSKGLKNGKDPVGLKVWKTRKEHKMHKLYDQWRDEERRIQEKREEAEELAEEKVMEEEESGVKWRDDTQGGAGGKRKKKGKRAKLVGEAVEREDDPWEELKKKRGEGKIGLHDVAQAPPELKKLTGKKLTVRGAAVEVDGIPKAAGSLRRREELQEVRNELVSSYRQMMEKKRANAAAAAGV